MEPMNEAIVQTEAEPKPNKRASPIERANIGKAELEKINLWIKQLEDSSKGFMALTKSDLVNFLIREHRPELSAKELCQIRADHYDPIRHLNWITPRLKEALEKSNMAQVTILQGEIRSIELSVISNSRSTNQANYDGASPTESEKPKRKKLNKSPHANSLETLSIAEIQGNLPED